MTGKQLKLLSKMKKLITEGNKRFASRKDRDYLAELAEIGITESLAWQEILTLSKHNYVYDYKPFYSKSENSLTFKKNINGNNVYIKLKIEEYNNKDMTVCLSFHIDHKLEEIIVKCDICGSSQTYVENHEHIYKVKGKEIKFSSDRRFCSKCNNLIYDKELDNIASEKVISTYNKNYGIEKEQIIALRKKYNLSQELFSKIIGCAKKTLISYEKGSSIPNDCYLIVLKSLIAKPETISNLIEASKEQFTNKEYNKINEKVSNFLANNTRQLLLNKDYEPSEYNGYTKLSKEKIYNMILFLADNCILKTKLLKEMFYADFLFYKDNCQSITGLEYCKLPFGPVPDKFETILCSGLEEDIIDYEYVYNGSREFYRITSKKDFDKSVFTDDEMKVLKYVKEYFKNYNSNDIVELSHKEKAFLETKKCEKISYDYSFDITSL